jgi:hypothetical protein
VTSDTAEKRKCLPPTKNMTKWDFGRASMLARLSVPARTQR